MTPVAANVFERHGIGHLSASSLNLWAAEPALWIMERLLGRKAPSGVPAARGRAVEAGVHLGLANPALPVEDCIAEAERTFAFRSCREPSHRPRPGGRVLRRSPTGSARSF